MALNFLRPGSPNNQLVGDLHTAKSAIFVGILNGIAWSSYLQPCLSDGAAGDVEQRYCLYQLANYLRPCSAWRSWSWAWRSLRRR